VLAIIAVQFYHLREVGLSSKHVLNSLAVKMEAVRRDLEAVLRRDSIPQSGQELVSSFAVALTHGVSRNQFAFRVQRDEYPSVSAFGRVLCFHVTLFLLTVCPDFVRLYPFALEILHCAFEQLYTAFSREHKQTHDRIAVQSGNAFCAANASAF